MDTLGLQTKLDDILEDKKTNLIPENIKEGVNILNVEGTLHSIDNKIKYSINYLFSNQTNTPTNTSNTSLGALYYYLRARYIRLLH